MATHMATDFQKALDPAWLLVNEDGTLNFCDWPRAEVLAEEWKNGVHNSTTKMAFAVIAIRNHLTVRPKE